MPVYDFEQDARGSLWLATERGLSQWNEADGFAAVDRLAGTRVNALFHARDGALWFGTVSEGVFRLDGDRWETVTGAETAQLNDVVVNGIGQTDDGSLWVSSYNNGLWRLRDGGWERMDGELPSPKLLSLHAAGTCGSGRARACVSMAGHGRLRATLPARRPSLDGRAGIGSSGPRSTIARTGYPGCGWIR